MIGLFSHLQKFNDFKLQVKTNRFDIVSDNNIENVQKEMQAVMKLRQPTVLARHYAFLDFAKYGHQWSPDFFGIVREPIERVSISYILLQTECRDNKDNIF